MTRDEPYGLELVLDLRGCDPSSFNRSNINKFFIILCKEIRMKKEDVYFWDDVGVPKEEQQTNPKTKGTSAVCFILTSTILVHTLDLLSAVYVNIFSCKAFDPKVATEFTREWFEAGSCKSTFIDRV